MATRFYLLGTNPVPAIAPAIASAWTDKGVTRSRQMFPTTMTQIVNSAQAASSGTGNTTTSGVTESLCGFQFISSPLSGQVISGTASLVIDGIESAATGNGFLTAIIRVLSQDGSIVRGTLLSVIGTDVEFVASATISAAASRFINSASLTPVTILDGDRLVVEVGANCQAPTASGIIQQVSTNLPSNTADYALTSGLTTHLRTWVEFSQNLFPALPNNYQFVNTGDGISTTGRIR